VNGARKNVHRQTETQSAKIYPPPKLKASPYGSIFAYLRTSLGSKLNNRTKFRPLKRQIRDENMVKSKLKTRRNEELKRITK
jgi:hypothetical protein